MNEPLPPSSPKKKRNRTPIVIAVIAAIAVVAIIGVVILTNHPNTTTNGMETITGTIQGNDNIANITFTSNNTSYAAQDNQGSFTVELPIGDYSTIVYYNNNSFTTTGHIQVNASGNSPINLRPELLYFESPNLDITQVLGDWNGQSYVLDSQSYIQQSQSYLPINNNFDFFNGLTVGFYYATNDSGFPPTGTFTITSLTPQFNISWIDYFTGNQSGSLNPFYGFYFEQSGEGWVSTNSVLNISQDNYTYAEITIGGTFSDSYTGPIILQFSPIT